MNDNVRANRQFRDAVRDIERRLGRELSKAERQKLHRAVTGRDLDFYALVMEGLDLFRKAR
jgi:DNA replication protein DnaD